MVDDNEDRELRDTAVSLRLSFCLPCLETVGAKAKDEAFHRAEQMAIFLTSVGFCGNAIPVL